MKKALYLLFLVVCTMLAGCFSSYQKRASGWAFVEWNAGVGYQVSPVEGADVGSFRVLNDPEFAADANAVYWRSFRIQNADPMTFRPLASGYWRDRTKVFAGKFEILGADPDTFRLLPIAPWAVDKKEAYRGFHPVYVEDIATFEVLGRSWAKDSKAYYVGAPGAPRKVPCDYATFRILNSVYSKDKDRAYWFATPIAGSDSDTFQVVDEMRAKDKFREYLGPEAR